ncbi:MAG TPA: polysaccharide biosynthesis tyrosine autokinase, partial [Gemmatimonadales bacterium]
NSIQDADRESTRRQLDLATIRGIMGTSQDVTLETVNRLAAIAAISSNPAMSFQLENLLKLYDERRTKIAGQAGLRETNPEVQAIDQRIAQASRALVDATNATIRSLESSLAALQTEIGSQRAKLATYPGKQSEFAQLDLETQLQNDTYKYLLSQLEAARITAATISPYVQIVEPAAGAGRIGMGLKQKVMIGLIIGLFVAILMAFFLEYLDQTIKTSADVERALEVPVLGLIPLEPVTINGGGTVAQGRRRMNLPLVSLLSPDHPASEAYRTLRTNVTFVNAEQSELQCLVVTSPGPGEGKSTTAANLAITLAQQGSKTLLVDADLRRPLVHRAFNLVQEPGLTDVLVGGAQLREAIRPNVVPKLDVLPAGALPPNPSELLGSEAMSRLMEQLRGQYDTIIFDSPPTLAVTDATVLGASADAVILVVRAGETDEVAAQRALQQLRRVQAKIAGTVLNGMQKRRDRYYNYYSYYRSDWNPGKGVMSAIKSRISNML